MPSPSENKESHDTDGSGNDSDNSSLDEDDDLDSVDSGGEGADVIRNAKQREHVPTAMSDMEFLQSKVQRHVDDLDSDDDGEDEKEEMDDRSNSSSSVASSSSDDDDDDSDEDSDDQESGDPTTKHESKGNEVLTTVVKSAENLGEVNGDSEKNEEELDNTASNRLFVRNLPFAVTEEELAAHFSSAGGGTVMECHIPIDESKQGKGFAFVTLASTAKALQVKERLDETDFQGRILHILMARQGPHQQDAPQDGSNPKTYKQKIEEERREKAQNTTGWSASFVRDDAVVDNLADRLGLKKGDIMNVKDGLSSGDAAVRLALGETHIIQENRTYFARHGIDMEALVGLNTSSNAGESTNNVTAAIKRSSDSILVKNLPYDTKEEELLKLFHQAVSEPPKRFLLPPSRTIALVEYGHATDARQAFKKFAYRRFKRVPLYLEWAPIHIQTSGEAPVTDDGATGVTDPQVPSAAKSNTPSGEMKTVDAHVDGGEEASGGSQTVYVKNLNFVTTEDQLKVLFEKKCGKGIRAIKIPTKVAPMKRPLAGQNPSSSVTEKNILSMGFGFVECESEGVARKAIKALQGTFLDGHKLQLQLSSKTVAVDQPSLRKVSAKQKKLLVRNVPFQATRKELLQLFGAYGQLKQVRMPKKFHATEHRGFAFVEFTTPQEAQTAKTALSKTHLYGRHLVLEWANNTDEADVDVQKAQRDVSRLHTKIPSDYQQHTAPNKKMRFD
jgi:multiple RNA-binding domain-containing protein 1